jgi:putative acetyltransferase
MPWHRVVTAADEDDLQVLRELLREYAHELGVDLCFQDFEKELTALPGKYTQSAGGVLFLCFDRDKDGNTAVAGCIGVRQLSEDMCELKRAFVRPQFRRRGIARYLSDIACGWALSYGYHSIVLDTLERLQAACALYQALGFVTTDAYYENPLPDVIYMKKVLRQQPV